MAPDDTPQPGFDPVTPVGTGDEAWTKAGGLPQPSDKGATDSADDGLESLIEDAAEDGQADDDETEEVEHEGKKYTIPKALKPALMLNADYTRKTQSVAEERKSLEAEKASIQEARKAQTEYARELGKLFSIDERLAAYRDMDWAKLEAEKGPAEASRQYREMGLLERQRGEAARAIQTKHEEQALENQRTAAKKFEEGRATVAKTIPGWSNELAEKLNAYGTSQGYTLDELTASIAEPRYVSTLHKAYLYDQLVAKKAAAAKQETPEVKPVPQLGARKSASTLKASDPSGDKLSTKDWMAMRTKELSRASR